MAKIIVALGAAAAILPLAIYHLVETAGGHGVAMAMACERACIAGTAIGVSVAVIGALSLFVKNPKLGVGASGALLAGGVATIAVPRAIGFCEKADMACRLVTAPTLLVIGVLIILLSAAKLLGQIRSLRRSAEEAA